ncbi:MAG: radical SAM protein [Candidatus Sumerlaeia bacterium]
MMQFPIHTIHVEESVRHTEITRRVLDRLADQAAVEYVPDARSVINQYDLRRGAHRRGKQALLLSDFHSAPIKPCPSTPEYLCCEYQILNFGAGCPLDCSYCILQDYFSNPLMVVQANPDAFLEAAAREIRSQPERFFRLGTGEFADSLALDPLTGYAKRLIEFIRGFPNALLELKTKAVYVDDILRLDHCGRTVCAWSVNSADVVRREEIHAASLDARFDAARQCQEAGYRLAFHFDPIIYSPGWEEGYRKTVKRIFEVARPDNIVWISLGCFRYTPGLEKTIRERFPGNRYTFDEFIMGGDGKMRYPQPLRIHIYRKMIQWIREYGGDKVLVYFCMENPAVWQQVMGRVPTDNDELASWLDASGGWKKPGAQSAPIPPA